MPTTYYVYNCRKCGRKNYLTERLPPGPEYAVCMYCRSEGSLSYGGTETQ